MSEKITPRRAASERLLASVFVMADAPRKARVRRGASADMNP